MKAFLLTAAALLIAAPALAAPGEPRAVRGSLEWPVSLSAEPFIVVRGEDGRVYYADVSSAKRMSTGSEMPRRTSVSISFFKSRDRAGSLVGWTRTWPSRSTEK